MHISYNKLHLQSSLNITSTISLSISDNMIKRIIYCSILIIYGDVLIYMYIFLLMSIKETFLFPSVTGMFVSALSFVYENVYLLWYFTHYVTIDWKCLSSSSRCTSNSETNIIVTFIIVIMIYVQSVLILIMLIEQIFPS